MARVTDGVGLALTAILFQQLGGCPTWPDPAGNDVGAAATGPAITGTSPAPDAINIAVNAPISVTFTRNLAFDSVVNLSTNTPTGAIVLKDASGKDVEGSITYNPGTLTVTLWPSDALAAGQRYTAIVRDVRDDDGFAMPAVYTWSFTTGFGTDTSTLSVMSVEPVSGSQGVRRDTAIRVNFNQPLDITSVINPATNGSTGAFLMKTGTGANVAGTVTYNSTTASILFVPSTFLGANLTHAITVKDVRALNGVALSMPFSFSFKTGAEPSTLPQIVSTTPAMDALNVARDTPIEVGFSEPVTGLAAATFVVRDLTTNAVLTARALVLSNNDLTATFRPLSNLNPRTAYSVTIQDLLGIAGFPMPQYTWSFTTGDLPDTTPRLLTTTPAANATSVARNARVSAVFDSALLGVATATFVLRNTLTNTLVTAESVTFTNPTRTALLVPGSFLAANTHYTATLRSLTGVDGVALPEISWGFTTGTSPDNIVPTITAAGLAARAACASEVLLEWSPASDDVTLQSDIEYQVFAALGSGGYDLNVPSHVTARGATTYRVAGLIPGEQYYFTVRAVDSAANRSVGFTERTVVLPTLLNCASNITVPSGPQAAVAADFNADGRTDLAVACSTPASIAVLLGNGDGTFAAPATIAMASQPLDLIAADFTNDGRIDLVSASRTAGTIAVHAGAGNGAFAPPIGFAVAGVQALAAGEFDNPSNANLDLALATGDDVTVLSGNGDGTFAAGVTRLTVAATADVRDVAAADFDSDGRVDIAASYGGTDSVGVWLNSTAAMGVHAFTAPTTATNRLFTVQNGPSAIVAADLNFDGVPDVAVTNTGTPSVTVRHSSTQAANLFPAGENTALTAGSGPLALAAGDIDGDGLSDLVTGNSLSGTVSVLSNLGAAGLFAVEGADAGSRPSAVAIADFDGDGNLDVAVANRLGSNVSVLLNAR